LTYRVRLNGKPGRRSDVKENDAITAKHERNKLTTRHSEDLGNLQRSYIAMSTELRVK